MKTCTYCRKEREDVIEDAVISRYVQYEEGMAGFDGPQNVGNVCAECNEVEFEGKACSLEDFG